MGHSFANGMLNEGFRFYFSGAALNSRDGMKVTKTEQILSVFFLSLPLVNKHGTY